MTRHPWYKLVGRCPVPCDAVEACTLLSKGDERRIAQTVIGEIVVSTVFLCLDHSFGDGDEPVLFETMIFPGEGGSETYQERCVTWAEAEAMHARAVAVATVWHENGAAELAKALRLV